MKREHLLQQLADNLQTMYRGMQNRKDYQKYGIPLGQKATLFTIALHKSINVKQLAKLLHITSGAATQQVEGLVREGLVERSNNPDDRRNVTITLSDKGNSLIKKLEKDRTSLLQEIFSIITDEELMAYNRVTEKVNKHMN